MVCLISFLSLLPHVSLSLFLCLSSLILSLSFLLSLPYSLSLLTHSFSLSFSLSLPYSLSLKYSLSLSLSCLVLSLSPTHLSNCPGSVGIHCGIWTPGVRKQPWYLILNVLNICFSVYWFDFNTLLKAETFLQTFFYTYEKKKKRTIKVRY